MVDTFRCWGHGGCLNKGGFSKNSTIFAWHLTRFGSLMVCMLVSPLTWQNWKKIKIPGLFKTFGQFLCPIHALFYRAFSHPSFIILLFFPTPPIKLKLGQQQQQIRGGGTTNSKTIWTNYYYDGAASNQKYWAVVRSNLLHSLSRCTVFAAVPFFTSHRKLCNYAELKTNHFPEPNQTKPAMFSLFFIQFYLSGVTYWAPLAGDVMPLKTSTNAQKHFSHIQVFSYELFNHKKLNLGLQAKQKQVRDY